MKRPILYVDDEEINLDLFEMLLNTNYRVFKAKCAEDALELLREHDEIEIVFTDWRMGKSNGLELAREAKNKFDKHIVMISAFMRNEEINRALEEGHLSSYISKPFDRQRIISEVDKLVKVS